MTGFRVRVACVSFLSSWNFFSAFRRFCSLEVGEQKRLARQIGTTVEQIIDNLLEIDLGMEIL